MPWSAWKSASSRSVRTPFARRTRSITPIERVRPAGGAARGRPARSSSASKPTNCGSGIVDAPALERDRAPSRPCAACDLRECVERVDVARERRERGAVLARAAWRRRPWPGELAELDVRPGGRLLAGRRRPSGERIAATAPRPVAEQLARVRDARVRGEARLQPRHRVERAERGVVAAELDERVADDAVAAAPSSARCARARRPKPSASPKRWRESASEPSPLVASQIARGERQRPAQDAVGLRVVRRVAGLARALLVGEPEQAERVHVARVAPHGRLELRRRARSCRRRRSRLTSSARPRRRCGAPPRPPASVVGAARRRGDEGGGGKRRRRPCDARCRLITDASA